MALTKRTYVDGETVITAENLNDIQDEIIANGTAITEKVDKVQGKGLSTEDYTTAEKTKLGALPTAAELDSELDAKADVIVSSASGDIVSVNDGANGLPVKDLTISIDPVQDLHGYDYPWPAGGRGNIFPVSTLEGRTDNDVT